MIENFKNTLKHEDYTLTEDIITDVEWMTNFSTTLDMLDNTTYKLGCTLLFLRIISEPKLPTRHPKKSYSNFSMSIPTL